MGKITEILDTWFKDRYDNEAEYRHDRSHALSALEALWETKEKVDNDQ